MSVSVPHMLLSVLSALLPLLFSIVLSLSAPIVLIVISLTVLIKWCLFILFSALSCLFTI